MIKYRYIVFQKVQNNSGNSNIEKSQVLESQDHTANCKI